jgi:hypothetical protein
VSDLKRSAEEVRYPYNILWRYPSGWLIVAFFAYGAFAFATGIAYANVGGGKHLVYGVDARILGFLFLSAALGWVAFLDWKANRLWKMKVVMLCSLATFLVVCGGYLFWNLTQ